jgi:DNA-binding NarL/FixJ family response regulator
MTIRVMLLDDPPSLLDTLHDLLRGADDVTVVARGKSGHEALAALLDRQADVIVLDLRVPVIDGLATLGTVAERHLGFRVVLLPGAVPGADGPGTIRRGVSFIAHGGVALRHPTAPSHQAGADEGAEPEVGTEMGRGDAAGAGLTIRELDIVRAIASGLRNRAIAERLQVTEGTVKVHLHNIYRKLGLDGRLALMVYARGHGLV